MALEYEVMCEQEKTPVAGECGGYKYLLQLWMCAWRHIVAGIKEHCVLLLEAHSGWDWGTVLLGTHYSWNCMRQTVSGTVWNHYNTHLSHCKCPGSVS